MMTFLYYSIAWPFILIGTVMEFIVWEIFSDGRWKQREVHSNPVVGWQNEALAATRELREREIQIRCLEEELEQEKRKK